VTPATLAAAIGCTAARAELFAPYIDEACALFQINTDPRLAAFLAQVGHESGSLVYTVEIASGEAYEGRADLGNTQPGDGKRYRGHGLIQTTGRFNHKAVTNGLHAYGCPDFEAEPERLSEPRWAALSAGWFWQNHGCNQLADVGNFEAITKRINGGLNGQADRLRRWEKAKAVLIFAEATPAPVPETNAPAAQPGGSMPIPLILGALLPSLIDAIPKLASIFKPGSVVAERNVKAAELVFDIARTASGAVNAQEAVEKIQADPAVAATVAKAVEDRWYELTEAGGGIVAAREADAKFVASGLPVWRSPSFLFTLLMWPIIVSIVGALIGLWGTLKLSESLTGNMLTGIITAILFGGAGYYYGAMTSANKPSP
jgi:putative chitinase